MAVGDHLWKLALARAESHVTEEVLLGHETATAERLLLQLERFGALRLQVRTRPSCHAIAGKARIRQLVEVPNQAPASPVQRAALDGPREHDGSREGEVLTVSAIVVAKFADVSGCAAAIIGCPTLT